MGMVLEDRAPRSSIPLLTTRRLRANVARNPMASSLRLPHVKPWVRRHVEVAGSYRVFDVLKADMLLPSGAPCPHPIYTFTCPSWCNVLAITPENEAVLVWQYRHGTDALSLEMPGGVVDAGEAPIDGARRELLEETGYAVDSIEPLSTVHPNPALQGNSHYSFLARGARKVAEPKLDASEECEVALVPVAELAPLLDEGHITHVLCVAPLERFLRHAR
jgi:ADP-ribose pyrophosphatase